MKHWSALAIVLAIMAAVALRVPKLDLRPLHNDEAVNATKAAELWKTGKYKYDPDEYHGPTLHYASVPFFWLSGARNANDLKDAWLRAAPISFGIGLILLLPLFSPGMSRGAIGWAAMFVAISPAMVFYSRYFIHEMLLVFFSALTLGAGWRYSQTGAAKWAALTGAGTGLMFATKETFIITVAGMVVALIATCWWLQIRPSFTVKNLAVGTAAFLAVWLIFFTSFFTNWSGLADSIKTYLPWLKRAGGASSHIHPATFYFKRVLIEYPVLILAVYGGYRALKQRNRLATFVVFFTLAVTGAYTIISYKTPWCLLNFYFGMILLAGMGAAELFQWRKGMAVAIAASVVVLTARAYRVNFVQPWDRANPYVYAQTVPDLLNLVKKAEGIAAVAPESFKTVVKVIGKEGDYWPLPWYLRRFETVGWYDQMPEDPYAPIVVVSQKFEAALDEKSDKKWIMVGYTEMRPKVFLEMYVELELWKKYVATLPRVRDDE